MNSFFNLKFYYSKFLDADGFVFSLIPTLVVCRSKKENIKFSVRIAWLFFEVGFSI